MVVLEIALGVSHCVWGDGDNLSIQLKEFGVVLAQLRQMPAAEGSHETAQENQHDIFLAVVIAEGDLAAID
jgi:hypothetical protein